MASTPRRFDAVLSRVGAAELKSMARMWGGGSQTRKDQCITLIRQGLADPEKVRAAVATLLPWEANALALLKAAGGALDGVALCVALRATGANLPGTRTPYGDDRANVLSVLIRRGLALSASEYSPTYMHDFGSANVYSDERLLAAAGLPEITPFKIKPIAPPDATIQRRPQSVALDLIGLLQAVENQGGIGLTQNGAPRVNDMRRVAKAVGWTEDVTQIDGLAFPNLAPGLIYALWHGGILKGDAALLNLAAPVNAFAAQSYAEQTRQVFHGFVQANEWDERGQQAGYFETARLIQARQALIIALTALPGQGASFFTVDELERALYERIGEHFSLSYLSGPPYSYGKTAEQARQELLAWQAKLRQNWLGSERVWLEHALATWCHFLGVVELGFRDKTLVALRLTDLGRAILHGEAAPAMPAPTAEARVAWVVQPNFEVVVYLDRASPEQLAFLERHAERFQTQQHVAQYRLTRQVVYTALESGSKLDRLLAALAGGAGRPLPQNVAAELREWAALREQVTLYRRARLLEFADAASRDAEAQRLSGAPVGDRFLLIGARQAKQMTGTRVREHVNYAAAPAKCLTADEEGIMAVSPRPADMLLDAQLGRWAEPRADQRWQLTQASVAAGLKAGGTLAELLKLLADRLIFPLPPLLEVALRAWAGEPSAVGLAGVTVLQCAQPAIFTAIVASLKLRRFLRGELAPDLVVVDRGQLDAFQAHLRWAGLAISPELTVKQRRQ
jgi:hypothetical protein